MGNTPEQVALPVTLEGLPASEQSLLKSCALRDIGMMKRALQEGASLKTAYYDPQDSSGGLSGKKPLHAATSHSFSEGICLLVERGVDVDVVDSHPFRQNTALIIASQHKEQFALLLALGAEMGVTNRLNHDARSTAEHADKVLYNKPPFKEIIGMFDALPVRDDFSGLTLEELLKCDESGLCLLDNPKTLRYIDEVVDALAQSGTPLKIEHLLQTTVPKEAQHILPDRLSETLGKLKIGVPHARVAQTLPPAKEETTYLERVADVGSLPKLIAALNRHGERFQSKALLEGGEASPLLEVATRRNQAQAFFTENNWRGGELTALTRVYKQLPQESRWQVNNFQRLSQSLRAAAPRGQGVGR